MQNLRDLNLKGTKITDAGLERVKSLTNLKTLDLSHTQITDAGLAHLKGLPQLQKLTLEKAENVTDAGVADLQAALPNCKISK